MNAATAAARSRAGQPRPVRTTGTGTGWLHVCNGLVPTRDGGIVPSVLGMSRALAGQGGDVAVVTPTPSDLPEPQQPPGVLFHGREPDLAPWIERADILHLHGLWQGHTRRGCRIARAHRVPYLIAAHGHAEPWSLRHKALRKRIYTALVEGKNLRRAACLHALTHPEVGHLRALAPRTPVCLVPNGVDLAPFDGLPPRAEMEAIHPELAGKFVLLFFGRLHRKKGLDLLGGALASLAGDFPALHLLVAGADDGARAPFERQLAEAGLSDRATFVGHVAGEAARRAWGAADAFALPSYSEGFSMAILEALAARRPVLATTACHFGALAERDAGLVVEPTIAGVTSGLRGLLERSPAEREAMAARGRRLVEAEYTWDRQGARLAAVYRWLLGGGPAPEAVVER
jgi:glycosyltransferase involved in cell wall biosynthesis